MKRAVSMHFSTIFFCWFLLVSSSTFANDSIGSVAVGGIAFLKSEDVRLVREYLLISPDAIRIRYRFLNESGKDIYTTVAFPMPPYGWNPGWYMGMANERPLETFKVNVNGKHIDTRRDMRAMIGNKDVTGLLRNVGLTDEQLFKTFAMCLDENEGTERFCGVTKAQEDRLKQIGSWKVAETALWEQSFPSHEEIEVRHEYVPFVGDSYMYVYQQGKFDYSELEQTSDACLDPSTTNAIKRKVQSLVNHGATVARIRVKRVEYILGTGRNWKGPIKEFSLRLEKDSPNQILSLCFPGTPKRINQTALEFKQNNYVPQDMVTVYFFEVRRDI